MFVGVSRSALEAMAAGIPVIIAGNEGYIGIFDESKYDISYETNYCCRGCQAATDELILNDLLKLMSLEKDELTHISEYNKGVIYNLYSADRMSNDYIDMYNSLTPIEHYKHADIIINGYYGYKNTGDDALLQAMVENIRQKDADAKITVLSASPKETAYRYSVNSIYRYDIIKIMKEMKHASLFISGGGSLLQDITSTKSLIYYSQMIKLAKKSGLKVMIFANGFGPISKTKNYQVVKKSLENVDYISMREPQSTEVLKEFIPNAEIITTADPAFSLTGVNDKWLTKLLSNYGIDETKKYFALSVRGWQDNDVKIESKISEFCNSMYKEYGMTPVFVSMQDSKDLSISKKIISELSCESVLITNVTAKELISILGKMEFTIGMRLHFLVFSVIAATPTIPLSYDPKINSFIQYIGLDSQLSANDIDLSLLYDNAKYIINNRDNLSEYISERCRTMCELNLIDANSAVKLSKK